MKNNTLAGLSFGISALIAVFIFSSHPVSAQTYPRGVIFAEARDTEGNLLSGDKAKWTFPSVPDNQTALPAGVNRYFNVLQGKYTIEAGAIDGYVLDSIKTGKGTVLPLAGAGMNQATQWLCYFSPEEIPVSRHEDCAKFAPVTTSAGGSSWGPTSFLKDIFATEARAVVVDSGDDSYCLFHPADVECTGWTDPTLGGGSGDIGAGDAGALGRRISFILIYKKATAAPGGGSAIGRISIDREPIKDGETFNLTLTGADSVLGTTPTRLFIDSGEGKGFEDFGAWKTVAELRSGSGNPRKLNCKQYSSYTPSGYADISGKVLNQKIKIRYEGLGTESEVTLSTKDCGAATGGGPTEPGSLGALNFNPVSVKNGQSFTISLEGVSDSIPNQTLARLWIDTSEDNGITWTGSKDFGIWKTVGELETGLGRTMNCAAYQSYQPGQTVNVSGKVLRQKVKVGYEGFTGYSTEVEHVKDCSGSGVVLPPPPGEPNVYVSGSSGATWKIINPLSPSTSYADSAQSYLLSPGTYLLDTGTSLVQGVTVNGAAAGFTVNPFAGDGFSISVPATGKANVVITLSTVPVSVSAKRTYAIQPAASSVAVGAQVQFKATEYLDGVSSGDVTGASETGWSYDPFYVRPGNTPGSFIGVNPGVSNIKFSRSAYYITPAVANPGPVTATAEITVTGSGAGVPGKGEVSITTSKNISSVMFPQPAGCDQATDKGCVRGFEKSQIKIDTRAGVPVIWGDELLTYNPIPMKGNSTGPRLFTLSDPMNPARDSVRSGNNLSTNPAGVCKPDDYAGDYGDALKARAVAYSKDGSYQFEEQSQGMIFAWHNGVKRGFKNAERSALMGVSEYGGNVYLITGKGAYNAANFETLPTATPKSGCPAGSDNQVVLPALPIGAPQMANGVKTVLSNERFVASYDGPGNGAIFWIGAIPAAPKLRVYDMGSTIEAASADAPAGMGFMFNQDGGDGSEYIYLIYPPAADPGVPSAPYQAHKVYVFRFDYAAKRLDKIADGVPLDAGRVSAAAAFKSGTKMGLLVAQETFTGLDSAGYVIGEKPVRAYFLPDLITNKAVNVLSNAPANMPVASMASLVKDGATYVYLVYPGSVTVWQMGTAAPGGGAPTCSVAGQVNPHYESVSGSCVSVASCGVNQCTPTVTPTCPSGQVKPHYESIGGSCVSIGTCGVSQCTPSSGGAPTGCDFNLLPIPGTLTVKTNSSFAVFGLKETLNNPDKTCTISVTAEAVKDSAGNRVISPSSAAATLITPGAQTVIYFNLNSPPVGSYAIKFKAYARGIAQKIINAVLNVE